MLLAGRIAYLANDGLDRYPPAGRATWTWPPSMSVTWDAAAPGRYPLFNEALRKFLAEVYLGGFMIHEDF